MPDSIVFTPRDEIIMPFNETRYEGGDRDLGINEDDIEVSEIAIFPVDGEGVTEVVPEGLPRPRLRVESQNQWVKKRLAKNVRLYIICIDCMDSLDSNWIVRLAVRILLSNLFVLSIVNILPCEREKLPCLFRSLGPPFARSPRSNVSRSLPIATLTTPRLEVRTSSTSSNPSQSILVHHSISHSWGFRTAQGLVHFKSFIFQLEIIIFLVSKTCRIAQSHLLVPQNWEKLDLWISHCLANLKNARNWKGKRRSFVRALGIFTELPFLPFRRSNVHRDSCNVQDTRYTRPILSAEHCVSSLLRAGEMAITASQRRLSYQSFLFPLKTVHEFFADLSIACVWPWIWSMMIKCYLWYWE